MMRSISRIRVSAAFIAMVAAAAGASSPVGSEMERPMQRVTDLIAEHHYSAAESTLDSLLAEHPGTTVLHFQKMALYYTWLDDYGIADSLHAPFSAAVDSTLRSAERDIRADGDDGWAYYFRGSAYTYRSLFRSYTEGLGIGNVRSLASDAGKGIDDMRRARDRDDTINDVLLGVGKYHHWRSQKLPWPFSRGGDREKGIAMMEDGLRRGLYWQTAGVQTLSSVYMSEERYQDIIALVEPMHRRYPHSRFYSVPMARANMYLERYDVADSLLRSIREGFSPEENAEPLAVLKVERFIAELRMLQGREEEACEIARRLKDAEYPGVHPDWLRRKMGLVDRIRRRACPR